MQFVNKKLFSAIIFFHSARNMSTLFVKFTQNCATFRKSRNTLLHYLPFSSILNSKVFFFFSLFDTDDIENFAFGPAKAYAHNFDIRQKHRHIALYCAIHIRYINNILV